MPDQSCDGFDSHGGRNCFDNPAQIAVRSFSPNTQGRRLGAGFKASSAPCLRLSDCPDGSGNRFGLIMGAGRQDQPSLITRFAKQHGARKMITPLLPFFGRQEARRAPRALATSRENLRTAVRSADTKKIPYLIPNSTSTCRPSSHPVAILTRKPFSRTPWLERKPVHRRSLLLRGNCRTPYTGSFEAA